jgi:hypothetical protein
MQVGIENANAIFESTSQIVDGNTIPSFEYDTNYDD